MRVLGVVPHLFGRVEVPDMRGNRFTSSRRAPQCRSRRSASRWAPSQHNVTRGRLSCSLWRRNRNGRRTRDDAWPSGPRDRRRQGRSSTVSRSTIKPNGPGQLPSRLALSQEMPSRPGCASFPATFPCGIIFPKSVCQTPFL
jgi:hypothetical protein